MRGAEAPLGTWLLLLLGLGFLETSKYLYSEVMVPQVLLRRSAFSTEKETSYLIRIEGINRIVHLQRKSFIIANLPFYTFNMRGERVVDYPYVQDDCYFSGYVEDVPGSEAILSTCNGLWGHVQIGNVVYEIQPIQDSPTFQHLIYRTAPKQHEPCRGILEDQEEWESSESGAGNTESLVANHSSRTLKNDPVDAAARYLEYYVVCDRSVHHWEKRNETRVLLLTLQVLSVLHNIYMEVGLHIILIGIEMWTERDYSTVSQKKLAKTLERFYNYASFELQRHVQFDHAAIYTFMGEEGSFGMAWGESFCLYNHVSVSAVKASTSPLDSGVFAAHELGHSLGFVHDDLLGGNRTRCSCNCTSKPGQCIMFSGVVECRRLSNCSKNAYYEFLQKPGKSCLQNLPKEAVLRKECGNAVVEDGEDCDCGLVQEVEEASASSFGIPVELESRGMAVKTSSSGASSSTELRALQACRRNGCCQSDCKLKPGTDCLYGLCCEGCQFAEEGTLCRGAATDCDLPEYCTGTSADCPPDVHKQDGLPCSTGDICFMGKCSDLHQHCRAVFGKDAKRAPLSCFRNVNMRGDRTGNCGKGSLGYKRCEEGHELCGRIQCTNIKRIPRLPTRQAVLQTPVGNIWCWSVESHEGLDVDDIGATPDGSICGAGKICINRSCVNVGVLKYDCDFNKCNHRGVCNNRKNCHCAYGWAPPFCEGKGYGGSLDSGPPPKHKLPTNIIIGSTVGAVSFLLTVVVFKKYILPSWLSRKEMQADPAPEDTQPIEESPEEEAPPVK